MNSFSLTLLFVAATAAASAQTPSKPSTSTSTAARTAPTAKTVSTTSSPASPPAPWIKLPPGIPTVAHGPIKIVPIAVHYEDIKIGTGPLGASGKLWHLKYTGWRTADGVKFDSWDEHTQPVLGKDGKPELGPDGKPKMGDPQPAALPQGIAAVIPGFDFGLAGMRIGGKRRIFIPWQLAYGTRAMPDRPGHPGIPAKSDLMFDVELVDVTEMPPPRPPMPAMPPRPFSGAPPQPGAAAHPATPGVPAAPAASASPTAPATPATPPQPSTPAQPATPSQPQAK